MKKLHLTKANSGNYPLDKPIFERFCSFNNGLFEINSNSLIVNTKDNKNFSCSLTKIEEDSLSETFQGITEEGTYFRIVQPGGIAKRIIEARGIGTLSFGGMKGDSYAVHFNVVSSDSPDSLI
jgi:hypothetical protein